MDPETKMAAMQRNDSALLLVGAYGGDEEDADPLPPTVDDISGSDDEGSVHSSIDVLKKSRLEEGSRLTPVLVGNSSSSTEVKGGLVSDYGIDEDDHDHDEKEVSIQEDVPQEAEEKELDKYDLSLEESVDLRRSSLDQDDILLFPKPTRNCSKSLQSKIAHAYSMVRAGHDFNKGIQNQKEYRNPSIYDKLIEMHGIDEKGTNYPPELYDRHIWGKDSFYDELAKVQKEEMDKKEKERKERTKVEFMTGTKKANEPAAEHKRKSKWDTQPAPAQRPLMAAIVPPPTIAVSTVVTGNKATVIPALGPVAKKPK